MPGFLYFLEGRGQNTKLADARLAGLGYAFAAVTPCPCQTGPGGRSGVTIADPARVDSARIKFVPAEQTWRKIPGQAEGLWLGRWNEDRIGPAELKRPDMLSGHPIKLLDGSEWIVPIARGHAVEDGDVRWFAMLPPALELDDSGQWVPGDVLPKYRHLMEIAGRWSESRLQASRQARDILRAAGRSVDVDDEEPAEVELILDFQDYVAAAVAVLQTNYYVGAVELAAMQLLSDDLAEEVLNLLIDLPGMIELQKKTASATPPTPDGSGA